MKSPRIYDGMGEEAVRHARQIACGSSTRYDENIMSRLSSIIAILLLLTAAAPVMACVSGAAMSHEESACCREMHGQCGEMAKMGCCRTQAQQDDTPQIAATSQVVEIHWVVVDLLRPSLLPIQAIAQGVARVPAGYLPPGLLTARTSVLRI